MLDLLSKFPDQKSAWGALWLSALGFEVTALFFQYYMGLAPCIMCIYQRTAMLGILFAGLIPFVYNHFATRLLGFMLWGLSAIWGLLIAIEHVDIQMEPNPFFASCEIVPNFPTFLPLHELIPSFFAATGDCGNIDWQFLHFSMPQWMIILFGIYSLLLAVMLIPRLFVQKRF